MSSEARTVSVHILGREYRIRSTEDGDFVREVARYVDELMRQISEKMTSGTTTQIAVLAALNVAEELFRGRRDGGGEAAPDELEARMRGMLSGPPETREATGTFRGPGWGTRRNRSEFSSSPMSSGVRAGARCGSSRPKSSKRSARTS
jgi:cell division protein ZapA